MQAYHPDGVCDPAFDDIITLLSAQRPHRGFYLVSRAVTFGPKSTNPVVPLAYSMGFLFPKTHPVIRLGLNRLPHSIKDLHTAKLYGIGCM